MQLSPVMEKYVLHWGEMGTRWGVNRSVAQIHALLFLSSEPLTAEEISETLSLARSNVSNSLKELQSWKLIQVTHVMGDRRDHFDATKDVWDMVMTIVEERKRRELDPTLTVLRQCVIEAADDKSIDPESRERIEQTLSFMDAWVTWYMQMRKLPKDTLITLIKMGESAANLIKAVK